MSIKGSMQRGVQAWQKGNGVVGQLRKGLEGYFNPGQPTRKDIEEYWKMRERELRLLDAQSKSAERLPQTIARFGGRVALVTNFDYVTAEKAERTADLLMDRGFGASEYLMVDALYSLDKVGSGGYDKSRLAVRDSLQDRLPGVKISSHSHIHTGSVLSTGEFAYQLEGNADIANEISQARGKQLGYVAVISAVELAGLGMQQADGGVGYTNEDYLKARYGGILMANESVSAWLLVGHSQD
jgi:hypothetical protein